MKQLVSFLILLVCASFLFAQEKDETIPPHLANVLTEQYAIESGVTAFDFTVATATQARGVLSGTDVNQNGKLEVIFTSYNDGGKVHVFEIDGDNNLTEIWTSPGIGSNYSSSVRCVEVADLDNNGDLEIIVNVNGTGGSDDGVGGLMIYEYSMATSSFDAGFHSVIDSNALSNRWLSEGFDIYDLDNDGVQEIMIANNGTGSFDSCYVISFTGTFDAGATQVTEFAWGKNGSPALGGSGLHATYGDLDGDNNYEAIFNIWDHAAVLIVEATDTNTYAVRNYVKMDKYNVDARAADNVVVLDLDNDGRDEVYATLLGSSASGSMMVMKCDTELDSITQADDVYEIAAPGTSGGYGIAYGDLDGDGNISLFTSAYTSGKVIGHEYNGGDITDPASYTATEIGQHASATGSFGLSMTDQDLDGDGFNELFVSYVEANTIIGTAYEYTPLVSNFPYVVDFENDGDIPTDWVNDDGDAEDWKFEIPGGGSNPVAYGATQDHTTGSGHVAWVDDSSPSLTPANLISPELDISGLTNPLLQFWYWIGTDASANSELHVDIFNGTEWIDSVAIITNNSSWEITGINLTAYKSASTKIRFRAMESSSYKSDIAIDDISIVDGPTTPVVSVSSDTLNFGVGNILDTTAVMNLTISNVGGGTLVIDAISLLDDTDFILADSNTYPLSIAAFESKAIGVSFAPLTVGAKSTELQISHSNAEEIKAVIVTGNAINPNYGGGPVDPIAGGYYFANSTGLAATAPSQPQFNWVDISATGTSILADLNDDNIVGPYEIGFTFNYFGVDYTQFWLSSNGWIAFEDNSTATGIQQRGNKPMPTADPPQNIIAWFWDDMNPDDSDVADRDCIYGLGADSNMVISMIKYPEYGADADGWITAQIILKRNGNVKIQYSDHGSSITLDEATVGIENGDGTLGLTYHHNGVGAPIFSSPLAVEFGLDETQIPVELTSFAANINERDVLLKWSTATEINSDKYVVQRTITESKEWSVIGEVKSAGNSTELQNYTFADTRLSSGSYKYRLKMIDFDGTYEYSNEVEVTVGLPTEFSLSQNYPNPFNPSTKIEYALPVDSKVKLELYSITGEKVAELFNTEQAAGYHTAEFNSARISGGLASGVYIYRIVATSSNNKNFVSVKKMMLLK